MSKKMSKLVGMVPAIKMMHNTNNNKAISKDFAAGCGVAEDVFTSWTTWIHLLYVEVDPWVEKFNDKDATEEELQTIYKKIFPIWRQICRVGETDEVAHFHNNMFVRESDVARICSFAAKHGKSANGSVDAKTGEKVFRKNIETMIGIRMAQNAILSMEDYDLIKKYESALNNAEKAENRLNGYERNGKTVKGLREQLKDAEKVLADMIALIGAKGNIDEILTKNPILSGYNKTVVDLKSNIKGTEDSLKKTNTYIADNKSAYKAIMAKIDEIK